MDKVVELVDQLTFSKAQFSNSNDAVFAIIQMVYNAYLPMSLTFFFPFNHHYVTDVDF